MKIYEWIAEQKNNPLNYYGADWNYVDDGNEEYIICYHKATLLVSVAFSKVWTEQESKFVWRSNRGNINGRGLERHQITPLQPNKLFMII